MRKAILVFILAIGLAFLIEAIAVSHSFAEGKAKVKFAVDWVIYGAYAPWFTALDKGYYQQEGLEVDISRGYGAGADQIKRLASGERDLVFVDPMAVVLGRAKGSRAKLVANIYEKAPMAIFSLKKTNIKSVQDLTGHSLGLSPGGVERVLIPALVKINKVDYGRINVVSLDPAQKIPMMVAGKVDAITWYITGIPLIALKTKALGGFNTIMLAEHGLDLYSNSIGATEEYLKANGQVVKRFIKATIKGFQYARENRDEAVASLLKYHSALNRQVSRAILDALLEIVFTKAALSRGLGYMSEEKMQRTRDMTVQLYDIKKQMRLTDIYTNQFLP